MITKKDIVRTIAERSGLTQIQTKKIVQDTFDTIIETLVQTGRIELRKFGVFEVRLRKERPARNPITSEKVTVPAKNVVTFQPGKQMEERVRVHGKPYEPKKKKPKATKKPKKKTPVKKSKPATAPKGPTPVANPSPGPETKS